MARLVYTEADSGRQKQFRGESLEETVAEARKRCPTKEEEEAWGLYATELRHRKVYRLPGGEKVKTILTKDVKDVLHDVGGLDDWMSYWDRGYVFLTFLLTSG